LLVCLLAAVIFALPACSKKEQPLNESAASGLNSAPTETVKDEAAETPAPTEKAKDEAADTSAPTEENEVDVTVTPATETTENELSDEDRDKFATGVNADEGQSENGEEISQDTDEVLNHEIEEKCPAEFSQTRSDVEYTKFVHKTYFSTTCNMERGYTILLPADYEETKQYPVLYMLHGIFGDENSFAGDSGNKIREIVTNMAADGLIEETIVVCPNMYATDDPAQKPSFDAESCLPYDNFINDLVTDLMPHIECSYSVLTGRENTYLAGFSMGGRETLFITLMKPELFGYVCAISAAPGIVETKDMFMYHPGQLKEDQVKFAEGAVEPEKFIVCCGTNDSVVGKYPLSYHELLEANGAEHIWYEIQGADHDNNAIKSGLYNLFKQIAYDKANK